MEFATFVYQPDTGWETPIDPNLDSPNTLVLVFGPSEPLTTLAIGSPLAVLAQTLPRSVFASAVSHTIAHARQSIDEALVVCVARFAHTRLRRFHVALGPALNAQTAGQQLALALCETPGLSGVLVLADGLEVNGPALVRGLTSVLPDGLPIAGGMGADGTGQARTWSMASDGPAQASACVIGLYGPRLRMARSCRGGSIGFGQRRLVTRAQGHTVEAIDNQPALQLYRQYLGRYADGLPEAASHFPLTVFRQAGDTHGVIRYVLGIDAQRQTIDVAGDIPAGSLVQLSRAGRSELLEGACQAADALREALPGDQPVLALMVSCVGRRHVLGEQTAEELEPVAAALPAGSALAGFYSFGEISSNPGQRCDMHNMTLTLAAFWETETPGETQAP
ncbi:FIST C-terminal domain-containing protein [Sphaerotilus sp.]|uniref:FIST signal transduction protein n=1 Tax=Sphaerotilus sp. TaxID=2093942 RepID=UPI00286DB706|nr:FIST C-terminal domain-containing protein [Sphaerotilus sp.]